MKEKDLNRLISKLMRLRRQIELYENDPALIEGFEGSFRLLKMKYGHYINDLLFEIYDEHCEDCDIVELEDYLSPEGVEVEAEDFPGVNALLKIKVQPFRFVLTDPFHNNEQVVWQQAA